jgi:DNA-binding SARP family transcriptional activator
MILADEMEDAFLQIYLLLSEAALARRRGQLQSARTLLDKVNYQIKDFPPGYEVGKYNQENGLLLLEENQLDQAYQEFKKAQEIFTAINQPVDTSVVLIYLAGINCLSGYFPDAEKNLVSAQKQIEQLSILQPLILALSYQEDLLSCLNDHLPANTFVGNLILGVKGFRSQIPSLLESLKLNLLPFDAAQFPYLEIRGLGRASVKRWGELISVPEWTKQKTVRELFFFLLCRPEGVSREEVCLEFWPDSNPQQLKKQFKNALYRLRRAVGKETILYGQPSRLYHFNWDLDYRFDVEQFQTALQEAEREIDLDVKIDLLESAIARYQHPFAPALDGIWSEPVRYGLYLDFERAVLTLAEQYLSMGKPDSSIKILEQLLHIDPGLETACRLAMRSYAEKADRSGIERIYQRCCQALASNLEVDPSEETISLYQSLMI